MASYNNVKIYPLKTDDGIKHWLQWDGQMLRAYAEKVSRGGAFIAQRIVTVEDKYKLSERLSLEEMRHTTPEMYARQLAVERVRNDLLTYRASLSPERYDGDGGGQSVMFNGGW